MCSQDGIAETLTGDDYGKMTDDRSVTDKKAIYHFSTR